MSKEPKLIDLRRFGPELYIAIHWDEAADSATPMPAYAKELMPNVRALAEETVQQWLGKDFYLRMMVIEGEPGVDVLCSIGAHISFMEATAYQRVIGEKMVETIEHFARSLAALFKREVLIGCNAMGKMALAVAVTADGESEVSRPPAMRKMRDEHRGKPKTD